MLPARSFLALVCCVGLTQCSHSSTAPSPPAATKYALTGVVSIASAGALAGARVEVIAGVNTGANATTDGEGKFRLADLASGDMTLRASATGYTTETSSVSLTADQTVNFSLPPAASMPDRVTIAGVVKASQGSAAIGSARVDVVSGANTGKSVTADASGRYKLIDLQPGQMTIRATANGYSEQTTTVTVTNDQAIDFTLPAVSADHVRLAGLVVAAMTDTSLPLSAVRVTVTSGANAGRTATTDAAGAYTLNDLTTGPITVEASLSGFVTDRTSLNINADQSANFTLRPQFVTSGRAEVVTTHEAVASVTVRGDGIAGAASSPSGAFKILALAGSADPRQLTFAAPGMVERRTGVRVPGADTVVSLIASGFNLSAFDQMFRSPGLTRWTTTPPLIISKRSVTFTTPEMESGTALEDSLTDDELVSLRTDLMWAMPQLTGGTLRFVEVTEMTAAPGATVQLLTTRAITVVRAVGLTDATGYWGIGRYQSLPDGSVVGGFLMLDRDFDRAGGQYQRSLRSHELGHALGYNHVSALPSVMNPAATIEPNAFDLDACLIAFARAPGNRSPDIDPDAASTNKIGPARWSRPIR